jgi:hypothetical protein
VGAKPIKLTVPFEDAVKALLRTPPPPKDALPERPKAKKARTKKRPAVKRAEKKR